MNGRVAIVFDTWQRDAVAATMPGPRHVRGFLILETDGADAGATGQPARTGFALRK